MTAQPPAAGGRHRREGPAQPAPIAAETAPAQPAGSGPFASPVQDTRVRTPRSPRPAKPSRGEAPGRGVSRRVGAARAAVRDAPRASAAARAEQARAAQARQRVAMRVDAKASWHQAADAHRVAVGYRNCGPLEKVLHRDWAQEALPPPEVVRAIDRLAELPLPVSERLADGVDAIYVGPGGVPDLDDMGRLHGVPLPSGRATWDACAGAYGERKIIIGTRPSATPDVVCHEIGHALDDLDGSGSMWQSDSEEFGALYGRCLPRLVSDFHRQDGSLGRREFFADAFAAIASSQRPALVDMLGGDTRTALDVMLYFNVRYGI
ncbi:MAG TPA: hypothetical protein VGI05_11670 [Streptosporangiaceae bacterium]